VVSFGACLVFQLAGGHAWLARRLFGTWSFSAPQLYATLAVSAALPVVMWFETVRVLPAAARAGEAEQVWPRVRTAALCLVPLLCLVALPGKLGPSGWPDRLLTTLGPELGTIELVATVTVLVATLPTLLLTVGLGLWLSSHPGRARTASAYAIVAAWLVGVALAGWVIGGL
jgi:hypothetical protein